MEHELDQLLGLLGDQQQALGILKEHTVIRPAVIELPFEQETD